jgi:hypothetical protein
MGNKLSGCKVGACDEIKQRAKTPGSSRTDEVETRHGTGKATRQFRITVELLHLARQVRREKIVSRQIHLISGSQQDVVGATLTAIVQSQDDFIAGSSGTRNGSSSGSVYVRQPSRKPL